MADSGFTQNDGLTFEMNLKEDLAAELEEFILLSRLGIYDEAIAIADHILCRHLSVFPVMAEVSSYLIERQEFQRLKALVDMLNAQHVTFTGTSEAEFVEFLVFLAGAAAPARLRATDLPAEFTRLLWDPGMIDYNQPVQVSTGYLKRLTHLMLSSFISRKSWQH